MVHGTCKLTITLPTHIIMQNFITALKAEHLKKKGTGIYVLSAILGCITPILVSLISYFENHPVLGGAPYNYYLKFIEDCLDPFTIFFFPLLIIITVSRITQLDHKNGGWQLMETQPVNKLSIYFSKFVVIIVSMLIAIISLVVSGYLFAWILSLLIDMPEQATTGFAFTELLLLVIRIFLAGLILVAFQYVISVIISSFIWSVLVGFFLLLAFIFLKAYNITPDWYPLEPLSKISAYPKGSNLGYWITYSEITSFLLTIILLYIGFNWYRHKGVKSAFLGTGKRIIGLVVILIIAGGLLSYVLYPKTYASYKKTVVCGNIDSDRDVKTIYITDNFIGDTLAIIPVENKTFYAEIKKNVPLDSYNVTFDEIGRVPTIFSNNDSIHIDFKLIKSAMDVVITGTRLPENQSDKEVGLRSSASYYIGQNTFLEDPDFITNKIVDDWEKSISNSKTFKTVDNYIPKRDFIGKKQKLMSVQYLNLWNSFIQKRAALYPGKETPETEGIKKIKEMITLNDESLLTNDDYVRYVISQLTINNKEDIDDDTKAFKAIEKLPAGPFKDKMLFSQMDKSIQEASKTSERDTLITQYNKLFTNKKFAAIIANKAQIIEKLSSGKQAPPLEGTTLDNQAINLTDLKGKFVVIDVWATWCGPCKYESPYFDKMAIKYKNEPVQFVAASIDDDIKKWFIDAKSKSKSVLQIHINDKRKFHDEYNVSGIPRFILIDPDGNLVEVEMPRPSEKQFEKVLRSALDLDEKK